MIAIKKDGAELNDKLAEIELLRKSEEVRTAQFMKRVSSMLDAELRSLRTDEREGAQLMAQGITMEKLQDILRLMGGGV